MGSSKLRQLWDLFIEADCSSYNRSTWCDLFVSYALAEAHTGKPIQEIINFSNLNAIGNLVGCEILSDINQVVNEPADTDDLTPLRNHLLTKGWRGFAFLLLLGRQHLACSKELAHLLLFLYPLCQTGSQIHDKSRFSTNTFIQLPVATLPDIILPSSPRKLYSKPKIGGSVEFARSASSTRPRRLLQKQEDESQSNLSSEEMGGSLRIQTGLFKLDPMDFEYFTNIVRSDDDARLDSVLYEPVRRPSRVARLTPRDLTDDSIATVINSTVSPEEFSQLVVQLLISLATAEHTFCSDNSYPTCTQCIKFALENLCSLQFGTLGTNIVATGGGDGSRCEDYSVVDIGLSSELKVAWTQLLVICLNKIMGCRDVTCSVILAGVLPIMLRLLEDVVNKLAIESNKSDTTISRLDEVASGLVSGSIAFVHSMLLQNITPVSDLTPTSSDAIKTTVELLSMVIESGGGRLLDRAVLACGPLRAPRILTLLSQLVNTLKRTRWRMRGRTTKVKGQGRVLLADAHHHHCDSWGSAASATASPLIASCVPTCCVSSLFMVFVRILQNVDDSLHAVSVATLRVMTSCGPCCCLPVKPLIKVLIKLIKDGTPRVRVLIFTLLERTIYPQLSIFDNKVNCSVCCDASTKTWEDILQIKDLIISENGKAGPACVVHLLRVASRFTFPLRNAVIFRVFFPVFMSAKVKYLLERNEAEEFIILSSLSAFAGLLNEQTTPDFVRLQGVQQVLELASIPALSKHCSAVLEKVIISEANQDIKNVPSFTLLQNAADSVNSAFLAIFKADSTRPLSSGKRRKQAEIGNRSELLQNICVFWRSFANLVAQKPELKDCLETHGLLEDGFRLLDASLTSVTNNSASRTSIQHGADDLFIHHFFKLIDCLLSLLLISNSDLETRVINLLEIRLFRDNICIKNTQKICEVLVKCSLVRSAVSIGPPKAPVVPLWGDWTGDIPIVGPDMDSDSSGAEDSYVTADEGYEADIELRDHLVGYCIENYSVSSESSSKHVDSEKISPAIIHPKLCRVVIQILVKIFADNQSINGSCEVIQSVFQRLSALCHDSPSNCLQLCGQSAILLILEGFSPILENNDSSLADLRSIILDIIYLLARHAITKDEIAKYLTFFKSGSPPLMQLLHLLVNLCNDLSPQPHFMIQFPVKSADNLNSDSSIFQQHVKEGLISSWSSAAILLPIPAELGWSPWLSGCGLSFYIRIDRTFYKPCKSSVTSLKPPKSILTRQSLQLPTSRGFSRSVSLESDKYITRKLSMPSRKVSRAESHISAQSTGISDWNFSFDDDTSNTNLLKRSDKVNNQHHIFSIGSESLMLECWTDPTVDCVTFRLVRSDSNRGLDIISEACLEGILPSGSWHHVAINIKDYIHNKKTVIELNWIRDGCKLIRITLPFSGLLVKKPRDFSLLIGHRTQKETDSKPSFGLSNVFLFRTPLFTEERALCLFGLGPSCTSLADCLIGKFILNFNNIMTPENITSVNWDNIFEGKSGALRELRSKILLSYSAKDHYTACHFTTSSFGNNGTLLFRINYIDSTPAQCIPIAVSATLLASPVEPKIIQTFNQAAILVGGTATFLFLFARIIELSGTDEEQADGLTILLKIAQADCSLYSQFIESEHHKLIRKIFETKLCSTSFSLLKAIFGSCCSELVSDHTSQNVVPASKGLLKNSLLFIELFRAWLYPTKDCALLVSGLQALHELVHDENPYSEFNISQLNRVHAMSVILDFAKDRLLGEEKSPISSEACLCIVEIVRCLMGAPPEFSHIVSVMDSLLLLHPANATYITHLKNSFYQLLSAGQNYSSHGPLHEGRQLTRIPTVEKWPAGYNIRQTISNVKPEIFTSPVDPGKLSKALANLQVKQNFENQQSSSSSQQQQKDELDSNRYSDEATIDSGISGSCRENPETVESVVVKAADGSQQNLRSFFPSILTDIDSDDIKEEDEEKGIQDEGLQESEQAAFVEGLILVLKDVVLVLPDNMAVQVLRYVVRFETFLVIANHSSPGVRAAVVQLISSYLRRATDEDRNKFLKCRGFQHLANQISLSPASFQLADACLKLITPYVESIEDHGFINQAELSMFDLNGLPPLLALVPRSVHNPSLTHNLVNVLRSFYLKNSVCSRALLDHGLIEVLVKALLASAHISRLSEQITSQDIVTADLESLFNLVASVALCTPGVQNMQVVCDMRLQLLYASRVERESCGIKSQCVRVISETQCKFAERCVDVLFEKIMSLQNDQSRIQAALHFGDDISSMASSQSSVSFSSSATSIGAKELSKSELKDRFNTLLLMCSQLLVYEEIVEGKQLLLNMIEQEFIHHIFPLFLQMLTFTMEKRTYARRNGANGVLWPVRETLKAESAELLVWLISPRQALPIRLFAINTLLSSTKCKDLLKSFIQSSRHVEQRFTVFLWDLMYNSKMTERDMRSCMELKECLQQWGILSPHAVGHSHDEWDAECEHLLQQIDKQRISWEKSMESAIIRCVTKHDTTVKQMSEDAMTMTRKVVDAQNIERKSLMSGIRKFLSEDMQTISRWRDLVENMTHPRALWHFSKAHPTFWQLDPTEGPHRVRIRLAPTKLGLHPKYLKEDHRWKLEHEDTPGPLSYLFQKHRETCSSSIVIERLHSNEMVRTMALARIITPTQEIPGEILLGEFSIYFVADDEHLCQALESGSTAWSFEDVREVHHRRFQHQERALEIFLRTGRAFLVAFQTKKDKEAFADSLLQCDLPHNQTNGDSLNFYTTLWRERKITNWEYLTQLNKIAGRSYNDLMQYPVFPFVLADYSSSILDLEKSTTFRNLKKPMAVQDKQNEQHYIDNYNELLVQAGSKQLSLNKGPYHYGSHYSNSGTVLHFLVRLPPFTTMLLQYQDRNFDLPDRTFHSMQTTWRLTSCDSTTDVKEMLPEFFYLPEFFVNSQGLDLGVRQNGERVEDVELPPWAKGDPRRYILIHRQALEGAFVTENLPHWIDLVFGYKQTGKAAVDAINVFHPATYCGFDVESIQDPLERIAWETMVRTYGQTPKQLFRIPHPFVVQNLVTYSTTSKEVLSEVKGLQWGNYVGSPSEGDPRVTWHQTSKDRSKAACLLPLATNDVYALPPFTACLVRYTKEKEMSLVNSTTIRAALVSWNYPDSVIRVKLRKDLPPEPLLFISPLDRITMCNSAPETNQLWIGHQSGHLTVVKYSLKFDKNQLEFPGLPIHLQAHTGPVTALAISQQFSIVVSASTEGSLIVWDLNKVAFVRSIHIGEPVSLVTVSPTLGDIACVTSQSSAINSSLLNVYSINAVPIGHVTLQDCQITALCFSSAMEGVSVNVIACGLSNGIIRLWSTWDLTHVRDIRLEYPFIQPIISLAYSFDSQYLFAGFDDGTVIVWETSSVKYDGQPPKFLNLKYLLTN